MRKFLFFLFRASLSYPLSVSTVCDFELVAAGHRIGRCVNGFGRPLSLNPSSFAYLDLPRTRLLALRPMLRVDLILILWPIFFVAVTRQEPRPKPRKFSKPARKIAEKIGLAGTTVHLPRPPKQKTCQTVARQGERSESKSHKLSGRTGNLRHKRSTHLLHGCRVLSKVGGADPGWCCRPK